MSQPRSNPAERFIASNSATMERNLSHYFAWNLSLFPLSKGARILDIGCGPGLYFNELQTYRPTLYVGTDVSPAFVEKTVRMFPPGSADKALIWDLMEDGYPPEMVRQRFDHVLFFDVLEHLDNQSRALTNIHRMMADSGSGQLLVRVPALQSIYGTNDEAISHFRRYNKKSLRLVLEAASFRIEFMRYQNLIGILPWFFIGRVLKRSSALSDGEARGFDSVTPLVRAMEEFIVPPVGLTLCAVCRPV